MNFLKKENATKRKEAMLKSFQEACSPIVDEMRILGKRSQRPFYIEERMNLEKLQYEMVVMSKREVCDAYIEIGILIISNKDRRLLVSVAGSDRYLTNVFHSICRGKISSHKMRSKYPDILNSLVCGLTKGEYLKLAH
jgi:hypothetical protein